MSTSQNGWTANDRSVIVKTYVPGTDRYITTRKGDVSKVFAYLLGRLHREVEAIDGGVYDDWGYAERPVRGSSKTLSNHASGTGIDVNATRHPLGAVNTFDPLKTLKVRQIVKDCKGAIRWGGDYNGRKDPMHFEINVGPARLAEIVTDMGLRASTVDPRPVQPATPAAPYPGTNYSGSYQAGARGYRRGDGPDENIHKIQERIGYLLYPAGQPDGKFGPATEQAVRDFQQTNQLPITGVVDAETWRRLWLDNAVKKPKVYGPPWPGVVLRLNSRGPAVGVYQTMMKARGWDLMVDNHFGSKTYEVTRKFQEQKNLEVDGVVGKDTWVTAEHSTTD